MHNAEPSDNNNIVRSAGIIFGVSRQPLFQPFRWSWLPLLIFLTGTSSMVGQADSSQLSKLLNQYRIKTSVGLQLWSTYSQNMEVYNEQASAYTPVDNRINHQLRRSRFSLSGQPYPTLKFKVTAAIDLVGHDVLAGTEAGGNNGSSPAFRLWNAFASWQLTPKQEGVYLTAGYFVAPIGRESTTAALRSNSFEKAWVQNYLRRHLVGIGPGRAMGLMLGGQFSNDRGNRHWGYELALQNPAFDSFGGNSAGITTSPLLTGRIALQFGDPESKRWSMSRKVNYFGQRQGLTLSLAGSRQGATDLFSTNYAYGGAFLFNAKTVHIDGEYFWLRRSASLDGAEVATNAQLGYLRVGKNLSLPRQLTLEPVVSYWFFQGPLTALGIDEANRLHSFSGSDEGLDIGANLYFNPKVKLSLFYAHRSGSAGSGDPLLVNNNYFRQSGVGPVRRASYFGAGWVLIL